MTSLSLKYHVSLSLQKKSTGWSESPMYKAHTALLEDMSSVPAPTLGGHSNSGDPTPLASDGTCTHLDIHTRPHICS